MVARSFLYVPGDRPDRLAKAIDRAGDAILADLEDAVAPGSKDEALAAVLGWLAGLTRPRPEIWVRVNPGARAAAEIAALAGAAGLAGLVLAKADAASTLAAGRLLDELGSSLRLTPLIESAQGLLDVAAVARAPRVSHLAIGEADLAAELGITPSPDDRELMPLRMAVIVASAAAGIAPPTGPVHLDVRNLDGLQESTEALRRMGFGARSAIHPDQVPVIEAAFTPAAGDVAAARELVRSYDAALADGSAVAVDARGRFVDEAVVRSARRTVETADRLGL